MGVVSMDCSATEILCAILGTQDPTSDGKYFHIVIFNYYLCLFDLVKISIDPNLVININFTLICIPNDDCLNR
jgi:hypothetical protein